MAYGDKNHNLAAEFLGLIEYASGDVPPPPYFLEVPFENWMDQWRPDLTAI